MRRSIVAGLAPLLVLVASCGGPAASTSQPTSQSSDDTASLTISASGCGPAWKAPTSGKRILTIDNKTSTAYGVDLLGSDEASVYGEIDMLAPATTRPMEVVLPPGSYSFACEATTGSSTFSSTEQISGPQVSGAHPYVPVTYSKIQVATLQYRDLVAAKLQQLATDTTTLASTVDAGNLLAARSQWLTAHLDYERLGAAYDTFGKFDQLIDGRPDGLPKGVNDPDFTGFLRLEYGLWHGQPQSELATVADKLASDVTDLVMSFRGLQTGPNDMALRTHEILENTLQFELTGQADQGSHTNLATAYANVQGTQMTLGAIAPLLSTHNSALLNQLDAGLAALGNQLLSYHRSDGSWTPIQDLTTAQREKLDGTVSSLVEELDPIPDILELPIVPATEDG